MTIGASSQTWWTTTEAAAPFGGTLSPLPLATCLELARFLEMPPASVAPVAARLEKMRIPEILPSVITSLQRAGPFGDTRAPTTRWELRLHLRNPVLPVLFQSEPRQPQLRANVSLMRKGQIMASVLNLRGASRPASGCATAHARSEGLPSELRTRRRNDKTRRPRSPSYWVRTGNVSRPSDRCGIGLLGANIPCGIWSRRYRSFPSLSRKSCRLGLPARPQRNGAADGFDGL